MFLSVLIVCGSLGDKNLKMAAPLVAKLAPESSYYLVVIYFDTKLSNLGSWSISLTANVRFKLTVFRIINEQNFPE